MRKPMNLFKKLIIVLTILLIYTNPVLAQESKNAASIRPCQASKVVFDVTSLEKVLLNPELILDDPDAFWENNPAYVLAKRWHHNNNISLDTRNYYSTWIEQLKEISALSENERQSNISFQIMQDILDLKDVFDSRAIPHICSFLPNNHVTLNTTVHLSGLTHAWAFMTNSNIVINLLHPHYEGKVANDFMNTITHEVFHIGYGRNRYYRTEIELENSIYYSMLDALQNEGMAVYMAYTAQEFFPFRSEQDYILLEDKKEVKRLRKLLNDLFKEADSMSPDSLRKTAWDIGVMQRAYYAVGAHMAMTIDKKMGRAALIETVVKGPRSFVSCYNKLVKKKMRIFEFELPDTLSPYQRLKQAVLNNDVNLFEDIKTEILVSEKQEGLEGKLNVLGYRMLNQGDVEWAIKVFTLNTECFPRSANAYDSLGEAYLKADDQQNSIKNYSRSLEFNPENENAKQVLKTFE
jgi:tetratricopeptide (TPR) repeat protein